MKFTVLSQTVNLESVFDMKISDIYTSNNSVIFKDSIVYTIGSFNGSLQSNGTTLTTNYSRGIFLLKTTVDNQFISLNKIADNEFLEISEPIVGIDVDTMENVVIGICFRDKLYFSGDSLIVIDSSSNNWGSILLQFDKNLVNLWQKSLNSSILGRKSVIYDNNSSIIVTGSNPNSNNFFISKFNFNGDSLWTHYGGSSNSNLPITGDIISCDYQNNYYCSGFYKNNNNLYFDSIHPTFYPTDMGKYGSFVAKYDSLGAVKWVKCLFGSFEQIQFVYINSISLKDNTLLVAGKFNSNYLRSSPNEGSIGPRGTDNLYTGFLIMYDLEGNRLWSKNTHSNTNGDDNLRCATISQDNYIYTATDFVSYMVVNGDTINGSGFGNLLIEKYNMNGQILGYYLLEGASKDLIYNIESSQNSMLLFGTTNSNSLNIAGTPINFSSNPNLFIAKVNDDILSVNNLSQPDFKIYPNPTTDNITLISQEFMSGKRLQIFNIFGQEVFSEILKNPYHNKVILPSEPGIYFLKIENSKDTFKVIKN